MPRRVPLDPHLSSAPFSVADARAGGYGKHRLLGRDLQRPFHGIRSRQVDDTRVLGLCAAYRPRLREGQFFSHVTAALIHGMPMPLSLELDLTLHLSAVAPASVPRTRGVVGHSARGDRVSVISRFGYLVGSPLQTWRELATILDRDDLVAVADYMLSGDRPLASAGELAVVAARHGGGRGAKRLREAVERARGGVNSRMESLTRMMLVDAGLPEPTINDTVTDAVGRWVSESDLVYREYKLVIEYQGDVHRRDRRTFLNDIDRRQRIEEAGHTVILLTSRHVFDRRAETVSRVAAHLASHGWPGRASAPSAARARRR